MYQADLPSMHKIAELSGNGSSPVLEFANIPQVYRHLRLIGTARSSGSNGLAECRLTFEVTPTAGAYNNQRLYASGEGGVGVAVYGNENIGNEWITLFVVAASTSDANLHGSAVVDILEYRDTSAFKTVLVHACDFRTISSLNLLWRRLTGLWESTAAIDRIRLTLSFDAFAATTRFTLYGIR